MLKRRLPRARPVGDYDARQVDATLAFRLLAHAELEACLEDIARDCARTALANYRRTGQVTTSLAGLCAAYGGVARASNYGSQQSLSAVVEDAVRAHGQVLSANHGVKELNLLKMFLPLGVEFSMLDPVWLADMNTFGSSRGDAAHRSIGSQQPPDPVAERAMVTRVINGMGSLDAIVQNL